MIKRTFLTAALLIMCGAVNAAQQAVSVGTAGAPVSLDTNFTNIQANFTELYGKVVTDVSLSGTTLTITLDDLSTVTADLSGLQDGTGTDNQTLSTSGNSNMLLEDGGSVLFKTINGESIFGNTDIVITAGSVDQTASYTWTGAHTFQGDVSLPAAVTLPNDSVGANQLADGDLGDISVSGGVVTVDVATGGADITFNTTPTVDSATGFYLDATNFYIVENGVSLNTITIDSVTGYDRTPSGFTGVFLADTDVAVSTLTTAGETYTVAGVDADTAISITGGNYQIDAGGWVSTAGTVSNGDVVGIQQTSSASNSTETIAALTIGTETVNYSVTTEAGAPSVVTIAEQAHTTSDTRDISSWTAGNSFLATADELYSLSLYIPTAGTAGTVTCRVDDDSDMSSEYTEELTYSYNGTDTGEIEILSSTNPTMTAATWYFACQSTASLNVSVENDPNNTYTNGDYVYATAPGWALSNNTARDTVFKVKVLQ